MKTQPTAAQLAFWHGCQSAFLAALVSLLVGIVQYLSSGNVDLHTVLTVLGSGFLTALTMMYKSVSSNPNLAQAALDTANEAHQKIDQLAPWLSGHAPPPARPPGGPAPILLPGGIQRAGAGYPSDLATQAVPTVPPAGHPSQGG